MAYTMNMVEHTHNVKFSFNRFKFHAKTILKESNMYDTKHTLITADDSIFYTDTSCTSRNPGSSDRRLAIST